MPPEGRQAASLPIRLLDGSDRYLSLIPSGAVVSNSARQFDMAVMEVTSCSRAAIRWRNASHQPSDALGVLIPSPASTLLAAAMASMGSDLPSLRRTLRFGRSTSCTV